MGDVFILSNFEYFDNVSCFTSLKKNALIDQIRSFNNADLKDQSATEALRVRFFGKIQIRILVSKNGFCVSLPKSENGLITD